MPACRSSRDFAKLRFLAPLMTTLALLSAPARAEKLLEGQIEHGGKIALRSHFSVAEGLGPADRQTLWMALGDSVFEEAAPLKGEPDASGNLVLRNGVRIVIQHAGSPIIQVEAPELALVADGPGRWRIEREDVATTAKAAGITLSSTYLASREAVLATIIATVAGASAIAWFTIARRKTRRVAPEA